MSFSGTIPDFITWVNTYINTNGVRAITGAILNEGLIALANFVRSEIRIDMGVPVSGSASNIITFVNRNDVADPFPPDTNYSIPAVRVYDEKGNNIDYKIISQTINGFTIQVAEDGFLDYLAVEKYQSLPE
jgi:hypothetical protein